LSFTHNRHRSSSVPTSIFRARRQARRPADPLSDEAERSLYSPRAGRSVSRTGSTVADSITTSSQ